MGKMGSSGSLTARFCAYVGRNGQSLQTSEDIQTQTGTYIVLSNYSDKQGTLSTNNLAGASTFLSPACLLESPQASREPHPRCNSWLPQ